jgi:hypothetical protein
MIDVYCFSSENLTNIWAGYGARKWAVSTIETRSLPALAHCFPRSFTFYVAHPIRSIRRDCIRFKTSEVTDMAKAEASGENNEYL